MNNIIASFSIFVVVFATFISTNTLFDLHSSKQITKCPKVIIKNLKNEVLTDSIHFSDSLICIELIGETNMKYDIREIEINAAQDRKSLGTHELYFNIKSGDTLNISRSLTKLIKRRKELQQEPKENVNEDIIIEKSFRIIIELRSVLAIDKVTEQKSSISEWCRGKITTLYSE